MTRLYIPERAQPFPTTKTELGGLLCEVPKRWIESFRVALEKQLDGIFDGTPPTFPFEISAQPRPYFFQNILNESPHPQRDKKGFISVVCTPKHAYRSYSLQDLLAERASFAKSMFGSFRHTGLLIVTENSLTLPDPMEGIPATRNPLGPQTAINTGILHGFHVLQSTEADLCRDFVAALERLRTPSAQSGWVSLP